MSQPWDADVQLDRDGAAALIEAQFPDLAPVRLEPLGVGWDNTAWRVDGEWVFRFPRRKVGADLLEHENRVLPRIAAGLPLAVPVPERIGRPARGYPYAFAGYRLLSGETACRAHPPSEARALDASVLGRFLAALHATPVDDLGLRPDTMNRADAPSRVAMLEERLAALPDVGLDVPAIRALAAELREIPPDTRRTLVHGDLYARHLIVDATGRLSGVIDWGDVHLGDPAFDLLVAWAYLPRHAHDAFLEAYGPISEASWARARLFALWSGVMLVHYGENTGDSAIARAGRGSIERALAG